MHKYKKSKYLVLIPSFNELNNLKKFVKTLSKLIPVYILDDASNDGTYKWLKKNKIHVYKNNKNLGYEMNLLNGIKLFKDKCEYLITFDADGQHKLSDIKKIIKKNKRFDVIICNRKNKNRILETIISKIFYIFFNLQDPLSGFKVYRTKIISETHLNQINNFFLIDFLLKFINKNNIINMEIVTNKRNGLSRVGSSLLVNFKMLKIFFKIISFYISDKLSI